MFFHLFVLLALTLCTKSTAGKTTELTGKFQSDNYEGNLSEEHYAKIYSYTSNSKVFRNLTLEETKEMVNKIETWDDPFNLKELLPYYFLGYDYDKRPVWMVDAGKLNFEGMAKKGHEALGTLETYFLQSVLRIIKSTVEMDSPEDEIRESLFLYDMQNFRLGQLKHLLVIADLLRIVKKYNDLSLQFGGGFIAVNSNYASQLAVNMIRPLVGRLMEKVEVYGSNRNEWLPRLLKHFSIDILPPQFCDNTTPSTTNRCVYG